MNKQGPSSRLRILLLLFVALSVVVAEAWVLYYSWQKRVVEREEYAFTAEEARDLRCFPEAMYDYGLRAWFTRPPEEAARFFRQAVREDSLFMDAWLRLAQAEQAMGREQKARSILGLTYTLARDIFRWKWEQMLLARELGEERILFDIANSLVSRGRIVSETFQLLDTHTGGKVGYVADRLLTENLVPYLRWLLRWKRGEDANKVWKRLAENTRPGPDILLQYVDFLVRNKDIDRARAIWRKYTGIQGLTNPGFEKDITGRGFDWHYSSHRGGSWRIQRVSSPAREGEYSLEVTFGGEENISFRHLYQVVPVEPGKHYRLEYWWKSRGITTDQGPFVEVYGYDCKGFHLKGPMIRGTGGWELQGMEFSPPDKCRAIVVRLRRQRSYRFDNKISGCLWLDGFRLVEQAGAGGERG